MRRLIFIIFALTIPLMAFGQRSYTLEFPYRLPVVVPFIDVLGTATAGSLAVNGGATFGTPMTIGEAYIHDGSSGAVFSEKDNFSLTNNVGFNVRDDGAIWIVSASTSRAITFRQGGATKVIYKTGFFGINTGNPNDALDVVGTAQITDTLTVDGTIFANGDSARFAGSVRVIDTLYVGTESTVLTSTDITTTGLVHSKLPHCYMNFADSTVLLDLAANTWKVVTNATDSLFTKTEFDELTFLNDSVKISDAGDYEGDYTIAFTVTANKDYDIRVMQSGVEIAKLPYNSPIGIDDLVMFIPFYAEAAANDYIHVEVRNTTDATDITALAGICRIKWLHD